MTDNFKEIGSLFGRERARGEAEPAAEAPTGTRWVPSDAPDYGFDDNDDDIPAFSFPEA